MQQATWLLARPPHTMLGCKCICYIVNCSLMQKDAAVAEAAAAVTAVEVVKRWPWPTQVKESVQLKQLFNGSAIKASAMGLHSNNHQFKWLAPTSTWPDNNFTCLHWGLHSWSQQQALTSSLPCQLLNIIHSDGLTNFVLSYVQERPTSAYKVLQEQFVK